MNAAEFLEALRQIEREKEIPFNVLVEALEMALATAYKKSYNLVEDVNLRVEHGDKRQPRVFRKLNVVETVENPHAEVTLAEAHAKFNPDAAVGDVVEVLLPPAEFDRIGRIAAQTAKQVVVQRIREAERNKILDEYNDKIGEVLTGVISRREGPNVLIAMGKIEAVLPPKEQVPGDPYRYNERLKVFVIEVRNTPKGPQVIVSRTHPSLIRRLFELEVPEIHDGVVAIKSVAREPGARSKIAVTSRDERVDPVGSCVGHRGARVQAVVNELYDEKVDIVRWSEDNRQFITESLSPARVTSVELDQASKSAFVIVPDNQLSLAIGKAGQNVRLAAKLTGWRIDISNESQVAKQKSDDTAAAALVGSRDRNGESAEDELPVITFGDDLLEDDPNVADLPPITFGDSVIEDEADGAVTNGSSDGASEDGGGNASAPVGAAGTGD